jgi:hypothetical protein
MADVLPGFRLKAQGTAMPQQIIWTALPNGLRSDGTNGRLRLSVFVSPRLRFDGDRTTGKLQEFEDFRDWPAQLHPNRISFELIVEDGLQAAPLFSSPAQMVTAPQPDSGLWHALFDDGTLVRAHIFEGTPNAKVSSFPAADLEGHLSQGASTLAKNAPYRSADKAQLADAFSDLHSAVAGSPGAARRAVFARLEAVPTLAATDIPLFRREISENLLRYDPQTKFADKLAAAIKVADRLAKLPDAPPAVPIIAPTMSSTSAFAQFAAFHRRVPRSPASAAVLAAAESVPNDVGNIDFHRTLSALGEYPDLLRRLGLVIDLEIGDTNVPLSLFGSLKRVRVIPKRVGAGGSDENHSPATYYLYDPRTNGGPFPFPLFAAAPRGAQQPAAVDTFRDLEFIGGLLNLAVPSLESPADLQFDIQQVDADGAASKLLNLVEIIVQDEGNQNHPIDNNDDAAAPAFRTSGLSVIRAKYANLLMTELANANAHDTALQTPNTTVELFAEDIVRGFRFDVRRFPSGFSFNPSTAPTMPPWMSLHQRVGTFTFQPPGRSPTTLADIAEEGYLQPSYAQNGADRGDSTIYIHESVCHWQGWSLAAPLPATPVALGQSAQTPPPANAAALNRLKVTFEAGPGSLPRLRFGNYYQLRARTVDLAGNGPTVQEADAIVAALQLALQHVPLLPPNPQEFFYKRFELIPSPVVVPRSELTEGEAVNVLVIRSNGSSTADYAASLHDPKYTGVSERHVVPPKGSQKLSELHGLLDGAFGASSDLGKIYNICQRNGSTLNDQWIIDVTSGSPAPLPDVVLVDPSTGAQTRKPNGLSFVSASTGALLNGPADDSYAIHYEEQLQIPYLPDPLARGAALFGLPGVAPVSIVIDASGTYTRENQLLPGPAITALGYVTKIAFGGDEWWEPRPFRLRLDENTGPPDSVAPEWDQSKRILTVRLAPGEKLTVWLSSYVESNDLALLGLYSWWTSLGSPITDRTFLAAAVHGALAMLTPARKLTLVHAVQQPVIAPTETPLGSFNVSQFPGDTVAYFSGGFTIHALSTAKLDLFAIWTEPGDGPGGAGRRTVTTHVLEFPIHLNVPPGNDTGDSVPIANYFGDVQLVRFFTPPTQSDTTARHWQARHEFGDTKYRNVTYRLVATTRYREFFPEQIANDPASLTRSVQFQKIVKSTAQPPAPEISYIVPAFQWVQNFDPSTADVIMSSRRGAAVRVYLGASWHASGDGEQLAIVGLPDWGDDPIHSAPVQRVADVRPSVAEEAGLYPYPVDYDDVLGLWYSDLTFVADRVYFPFIKLRLARYQKNSLPGLAESSVVEAGIFQLTPDRTVTLSYQDLNDLEHRRIDISLLGSGASAAGTPATSRTIDYRIDVTLEERVASQDEDLEASWTAAADQPVIDPPPPRAPPLWTGHVVLPRFADRERRLVIREFELFPPNTGAAGQAWIGDAPGAPAKRLVYADAISIF